MSTDTKTSLTVISKSSIDKTVPLGVRLANTDPAELDAAVAKALEGLSDLQANKDLSDGQRASVANLLALASPQRPGMEEMAEAWRIPRIMIAQPTSQSDAKPDSARNGDLYTTSGQLLERPFNFTPINFHRENINFPQGGRNPVCSSLDGKLGSPFGECEKCPHLPFGMQNGGRGDQHRTDCQTSIVCAAMSNNFDTGQAQVYLIHFSKTSYSAGRALMKLMTPHPFVWKQNYLLNTAKQQAEVGLYYTYNVTGTGKDNDAGTHVISQRMYALYSAERNRRLAEWYARPARAATVAAEAEAQFAGGVLDTNLEDGIEPDLTTPPPPAPSSKSARNAPKPMYPSCANPRTTLTVWCGGFFVFLSLEGGVCDDFITNYGPGSEVERKSVG
jgi:hypothetical protein